MIPKPVLLKRTKVNLSQFNLTQTEAESLKLTNPNFTKNFKLFFNDMILICLKHQRFFYQVTRVFYQLTRVFYQVTRVFYQLTRVFYQVTRVFYQLTRVFYQVTRVFYQVTRVFYQVTRVFYQVTRVFYQVTRFFCLQAFFYFVSFPLRYSFLGISVSCRSLVTQHRCAITRNEFSYLSTLSNTGAQRHSASNVLKR